MSWRISVEFPWVAGAVNHHVFADLVPTNPPKVAAIPNQMTPFEFIAENQPDSELIVQSRVEYADGHLGPLSEPLKIILVTPVPDPEEPPPPGTFPEVKPGYWYRVPNSRLYAARRQPLPPPGTFGVLAESGGAFDTKRRRLVVWGGGHADYSGNELYAFSKETLSWSIIWPGTPIAQIPTAAGNYNAYPDGNPSSRHTRDGLEYLPEQDALISLGGSVWKNGGNARDTWLFDFTTEKWIQKASPIDKQFVNVYSAYDPITKTMLVIRPQALDNSSTLLYRYNPATNVWTLLNKSAFTSHRRTAAFDHTRNNLVMGGLGQVVVWKNLQQAVVVHDKLSGVLARVGWGIEYDPDIDRFVVWAQGPQIFYIHPETFLITEHALPADSPKPPDTRGGGNIGPHGRFRRDPINKVYIAVNHADDDVYLFRASEQGEIEMPKNLNVDAAISTVPAGEYTVKVQLVKKDGSVASEAVSKAVVVAADPPATPVVGEPTVTVEA